MTEQDHAARIEQRNARYVHALQHFPAEITEAIGSIGTLSPADLSDGYLEKHKAAILESMDRAAVAISRLHLVGTVLKSLTGKVASNIPLQPADKSLLEALILAGQPTTSHDESVNG